LKELRAYDEEFSYRKPAEPEAISFAKIAEQVPNQEEKLTHP